LAIEKDAVAVRVLVQAFADAHFTDIAGFKLGHIETNFGG
jgi:hypothetical protein